MLMFHNINDKEGRADWRRVRRGQRGTLFLKLLGGGDGAAYMSPEIFNKYKLKCLQCFQLFVLAYYFVSRLLVQTLKVLIWNYSLKCRGLNEHFYTSTPQIEDLLSPSNIGPSIRLWRATHKCWNLGPRLPCYATGPYMAARAGVEPTTLRLKAIDSTNAPPCLILLRLTSWAADRHWRVRIDARIIIAPSIF